MHISQRLNNTISFKENTNSFEKFYALKRNPQAFVSSAANPEKNQEIEKFKQDLQQAQKEKQETSEKENNTLTCSKAPALIGGTIIGGGSGYFIGKNKALNTLGEKLTQLWHSDKGDIIDELGQKVVTEHKIEQKPENHEKIFKLVRDKFFKLPENEALKSEYIKKGLAIGALAGLGVGLVACLFMKKKDSANNPPENKA